MHNEQFGDCWHFLMGWQKCTGYFIKSQQALLDGLDFFLMPEGDYEEAISYIKERKRKEGEQ